MKPTKADLDYAKISKVLGTKRRGKVRSRSGYFGALALAAEVESRFRTPETGGRATDPKWTEQRLLRMAPETLHRLEEVSGRLVAKRKIRLHPMQVAAILLEKSVNELSDSELEAMV